MFRKLLLIVATFAALAAPITTVQLLTSSPAAALSCVSDEVYEPSSQACIDWDNAYLHVPGDGSQDVLVLLPNDHNQWCDGQVWLDQNFLGSTVAEAEWTQGYCNTDNTPQTDGSVSAGNGATGPMLNFNQWYTSTDHGVTGNDGLLSGCVQNPVGQHKHYVCWQVYFGPNY